MPVLRFLVLGLSILLPAGAQARPQVLDSFDDISPWEALASEGTAINVDADVGRSGKALRLDFDFKATGGYVNVKKKVRLHLPENYRFQFFMRGSGPPNNLEFKLLDATGKNVWWHNDRAVEMNGDWRERQIWREQIEFAWGPNPGTAIDIAFIEFTVKASDGGRGSLWIDDLTFEPRRVESALPWPPQVTASVPIAAERAAAMFDKDPSTAWHSDAERLTIVIDLLEARLLGGLIIDWDEKDYPSSFSIAVAERPNEWEERYRTSLNSTARSHVYLQDCTARFVRIELTTSHGHAGYGIREISWPGHSFSATINDFFTAVARDAPVGAHPKYLIGKQTYWTIVGQNGDLKEALVNEEGVIEVEAATFSIEPFLHVDGHAVTWNDVETTQELLDGYLPIPRVTWRRRGVELAVTAAADGSAGASTLYATYAFRNTSSEPKTIKLYLALRPFQVNPPWQSLNVAGGATPIWSVERHGSTVAVRARRGSPPQRLELLTEPTRFGAAQFEEGDTLDFVGAAQVPARSSVAGGLGYASGLIEYERTLAAGEAAEVAIAIPWYEGSTVASDAAAAIDRARDLWSRQLSGVGIDISCEPELRSLLKSNLAYILINRDEAALQPGSRTYARSWIRDGALTSMAMLEMGLHSEVRDYLVWYAAHQFDSGRVPCCVDRRGADPTPEHDSDGELIYAIAEYYRYTGDIELVRSLWPRVVAAVDHLTRLRQERLGERYRQGKERGFYGLLPESISHEGYASHPVHSYWDDFFALRGFADAAALATAMGDGPLAEQYSQLHNAFHSDLVASLQWTVAKNAINYLPGSVELGDFDPTATSILPVIGSRLGGLEALFHSTFDRYNDNVTARATDQMPWTNYAPYEFRNVTAFVELDQRERAATLLKFLTERRRPRGWNFWPEVIWRDPELPRFIGDMPHTWVGASFISALRSMLLREDHDANALILAPGIPASWLADDCRVRVTDMPTELGRISYEMRRRGEHLIIEVSGAMRSPSTKIVVRPPTLAAAYSAATVNGRKQEAFDGRSLILTELPASVELE